MNPLVFVIFAQVVVESLPVSSSGHMMLAERLLSRFGMTLPALPDFFDHFLHGPTILVLMIFFRKDWFDPVRWLVQGVWRFIVTGETKYSFRLLLNVFFKIMTMVIIADSMTAIFYGAKAILHSRYSFFESGAGLLVGFTLTTLVLLSSFFIDTETKSDHLDYKKAILLGVVQGITLLPGISRFATTYVAALWLGVLPKKAFQFSFLIFFPLIVAGFLFNGVRSMVMFPDFLKMFDASAIAAFAVSTLLAYLLFCFAYEIAMRKKIYWFGFYMFLPLAVLIFDLLF